MCARQQQSMNKRVGSAEHEQGVENARELFPRGFCPGHSPGAGGHGTASLVKVPSPATVQVDRERAMAVRLLGSRIKSHVLGLRSRCPRSLVLDPGTQWVPISIRNNWAEAKEEEGERNELTRGGKRKTGERSLAGRGVGKTNMKLPHAGLCPCRLMTSAHSFNSPAQ